MGGHENVLPLVVMGKYNYIKVTGGQVYVDPNTGQRYLVKDGKVVGRNPDYLLNEVTVTPSRPSTPWEAAQRTARRLPNWRDVYGMSSDFDTMNAVTGNIMDYSDPIYWLGRATKAATGDEQLANNVELTAALATLAYPKNWLTAPRKLNAIYRAKGALLTGKAARKLMNKARRGALTDEEVLKLWTSEKGRIELQENPEVFQSLAQRLSSGLKEKLPKELQKEFDEMIAATDNVTTSADNVSRAATNNTTQATDNVANTAADNVAAKTTEDIWYSVGKGRYKIPKGTPIIREGDDLYVSTRHGDVKLNSAGNKASDGFQSRLTEAAYEKDINDRFYKGAPVSKVTKSLGDDVIYYTTPDYIPTVMERLFTQPTYVKNQPANWWTKVTKKPTAIGQYGPDFVKYKSRRFSPLRTATSLATTLGAAGLIGSTIWQGGKRTLKDTASGAGSILNTIWNEGVIGADSTEVTTPPRRWDTNDWQKVLIYEGVPVDSATIGGDLYYITEGKQNKYKGKDTRLGYRVKSNGKIDRNNPVEVFKDQYMYRIVPDTVAGGSTSSYFPPAGAVYGSRTSTPQRLETSEPEKPDTISDWMNQERLK